MNHTKQKSALLRERIFVLVCPKGFEPPTFWFVAKHSIQLSYEHIIY